MYRYTYCMIVAALVVGFAIGQPAQATVTVRFDPPSTTVLVGDVFTMDIVADIPDPVVAWGLDLAIAVPSVLSLSPPPAIGPAWLPPGSTPDGDQLGGLAFLNPVTATSVVLATITFTADAVGGTDLVLSDSNPPPHTGPVDLTEGFGLDPSGFALVNYVPGHVTVVPEPATLGLFALVCLAVLRRSRQG